MDLEFAVTEMISREVRLAARPVGWPTEDDFALVEVPIPRGEDGLLLVRNLVMSVDPYMRGRMNRGRSYIPSFRVGAPLDGAAVGEVVIGVDGGPAPGDLVAHELGWRDYALVDPATVTVVDADLPPTAYLGPLGLPGLTAYGGMTRIAQISPGDVVYVSSAAGAVGGLAGQLARLLGASRVIGSAGSPEKVRYVVEELGFDAAFDYHDGPLERQLLTLAPDGVDVYFDNVGGRHLEAAITVLNPFGRIAACGMISQYNNTSPEPGPRNLPLVVAKHLTIRGFIADEFLSLREEWFTRMTAWLRAGSIRGRETVVDGLANAPGAFLGVMRGANTGKMLVRLGAGEPRGGGLC
jgi:NADPH-dependent curcumin reductase CurA